MNADQIPSHLSGNKTRIFRAFLSGARQNRDVPFWSAKQETQPLSRFGWKCTPLGHWYLNEAATSVWAPFCSAESVCRMRDGEIEGVGGIFWIDEKKKTLWHLYFLSCLFFILWLFFSHTHIFMISFLPLTIGSVGIISNYYQLQRKYSLFSIVTFSIMYFSDMFFCPAWVWRPIRIIWCQVTIYLC